MGGIAKPWIPKVISQPKTYTTGFVHTCLLNRALPAKAKQLITEQSNFKLEKKDSSIDLVYIVKHSDRNDDLKYSLRSIEKFCNYRKVWIIGYKPKWVQNVEYVETQQTGTKWQNSMLNWETACKTEGISDNFILMNDDFIAIRPIYDMVNDINACLTSINLQAEKYSHRRASKWQTGFVLARDLLMALNIQTRFNMEAHIPFLVNKENYLKMLKLPEIQQFDNTKVLHKRSIYYNLYYNNSIKQPRRIKDVKIALHRDLSDLYLSENWISVFDDVIGNVLKFPRINDFLRKLFPDKCSFEV